MTDTREGIKKWTEQERIDIAHDGEFMLFCSEDEACDIIQEVESLCINKCEAHHKERIAELEKENERLREALQILLERDN